jgi:DNA-binding NarL/FixJ family response regulator
MLRQVLSEIIEREPDMEVVDREPAESLDELESDRADVVIASFAPGESVHAAASMHARVPGVRLLAIEGQEHDAWLYRLQPTQTLLGRVSPAQLVLAVRKAVQPLTIMKVESNTGTDDAATMSGHVGIKPTPSAE